MKKFLFLKAALAFAASGVLFTAHSRGNTVTWTNTGGSQWLTGSNWSSAPNAPGTTDIAQFGTDPTGGSGAGGLGINMGGSTNDGTANQAVGAIEIAAVRTTGTVTIGDSSSTSGTLTLNGATVVSAGSNANNVILHEVSSKNLTIEPSNGGAGTMSVALGNSASVIQEDSSGNITVSCNISEVNSGSSLTISGTGGGTVTLSGVNSFSGGLVASTGEVDVTGDSSLGATGGSLTINGGRLGFMTNSTTIGSTRAFYLGANPTGGNNSGTLSIKGLITVGYNGVIQDLNGGTKGDLVKQGGGTLQLGGVSTYSDNTFINNGTVQLTTGNNRLPTGTVVAIGQASSVNIGTLDLNGLNQQIAGLNSTAGTNAVSGTYNTVTSAAAATLTLGGTGTYSYGTGTAANTGIVAGAISLVKQGTGTQTLGGNNTYTGSTAVNGGTLIVSGSLSSTSSLTLSSGTLQLGQNNAIASTAGVTLGGGVLNAATYSGTFADVTNSGASTLDFGAGSTDSILHFADSHGDTWSGSLTILDWTGSPTGGGSDEVFFGSAASGLTAGQLADITFVNPTINGYTQTGDVAASITSTGEIVAVPEPRTWAAVLCGFGLLIVVAAHRRRTQGVALGLLGAMWFFSAAPAKAQSFTFNAGDLVISTVVDSVPGNPTPLDTASPIVLDQFQLGSNGTSATLSGTMVLPQTASGNNSAISGEYGSASEGILQDSVDGQSLTMMGYGVNANTFNTSGSSVYGTAALGQTTSLTAAQQTGTAYTTVPRVVALIGANGSVDTSTALTGIFNTNNPRSVATVNGSSFYVSGQGVTGDSTGGVFYATDGATTATAININTATVTGTGVANAYTGTETRSVEIVNTGAGNTLMVSRDFAPSGSGTPNDTTDIRSIASSTGGLPTGPAGNTVTRVTPNTQSVNGGNYGSIDLTAALDNNVNSSRNGKFVYLSPEEFFYANATTLYVADSGQPKNGNTDKAALGEGGLQKWTLNQSTGNWSLDYDLYSGLNLVDNANATPSNPTAPGVTGLFGLAAEVSGTQVELFATSYGLNELSQSYLYEITDNLDYTTGSQASGESFTTLYTDSTGQTSIRGVAFAPVAVPEPSTWALAAAGIAGLAILAVRRKRA